MTVSGNVKGNRNGMPEDSPQNEEMWREQEEYNQQYNGCEMQWWEMYALLIWMQCKKFMPD